MEMLSAIFFIVIGFLLLLLGGEHLVRSAVSIASRLKINPAVIGATIIAGGTSAPEMMTSGLAAFKGVPDIAIGNVVGSNIFNILAIVGIACLLKPNKVDRHTVRFDYPILIFATGAFLLAGWDGVLLRAEGYTFLLAMVFFLLTAFWIGKGADGEEIDQLKSPFLDIFYLATGAAGLIYGADLALQGGVSVGKIAGLSDRIIGITIISVGTGLPELATSAVAAMRGRSDLAIANIIGSNILNTFGVVGIAASIRTIKTSTQLIHVDGLILAGVTLFLLIPLLSPQKIIGRKWGAVFLASYFGYLIYLLV